MVFKVRNSEEIDRRFLMTDRQLVREGLFIAESHNVIERALEGGARPVALLCEWKRLEEAETIFGNRSDFPIYSAPSEVLKGFTGYSLTRGMMCLFSRPSPATLPSVLEDARRVCVLYDVCDSTNVGAIFRTAAALGYDAVILSTTTCDPLNRRVVRVSMGTVFQVPWCVASSLPLSLQSEGFIVVSSALDDHSVPLPLFYPEKRERYAVILGSEGWGLPKEVVSASDHVVKIPMHHEVDSLNVGAAAAILLWHFRD